MLPDILHVNINKVLLRHFLGGQDKMSHLGKSIHHNINGAKTLGLR